MYVILLAVFILFFSIYLIKWCRFSAQNPAGPIPLPFIGNIHQLGKDPALQLSKWAQKYGKIFTIYMGSKTTIVISDASLIRQLLNRSECSGRPRSGLFQDIYTSGGGISYGTGKVWQDHRPFFVRGLKSFERGSYHEAIIAHEIVELSKWFEANRAGAGDIYIFEQLKAFTSTIIWSLVCGSRQEPHIAGLLENWVKALQRLTSTGAGFFDIIGRLAPGWSGKANFQKCCDSLRQFVVNQFELEKANNCESNNLISSYIKLIEGTTDTESTFYGKKGFEEAVDSIIAMILGGVETTATALNWLLFNLCSYEDSQDKVHQEVDQIAGEIGLRHQKLMPYTLAFIEETLRMSSIVPMGLFHEVQEDFEFNGVHFDKGVQLIANIYHVNNDRDVWIDPEAFRPGRFLETQGEKSLKEYHVSFQPGKRMCPGESLARDILFLTVTSLVKCFNFQQVDKIQRELYARADRIFLSLPMPVPILIKRRK